MTIGLARQALAELIGTFAYFRVRPEAMERLHSLVEPAALAKAV